LQNYNPFVQAHLSFCEVFKSFCLVGAKNSDFLNDYFHGSPALMEHKTKSKEQNNHGKQMRKEQKTPKNRRKTAEKPPKNR